VTSILPLQRVRLELDRMIRERLFFARVIGGRIEEPAYRDLLVQLSGLIDAFADEHAPRLERGRAIKARCAAATLFRATARRYGEVLTPALATEIGLAILTTSWLEDATRRLSSRPALDTAYLETLVHCGRSSYGLVRERFSCDAIDAQHAYGFAELVRGAFLGVAAYLDSTWPAPLVSVRVT
jgi:hypothetical protein